MTRKTYVYNVTRDGRWWLISVPELDELTQARNVPEILVMVKDLIATWLDVDEDTFDVVLGEFVLPGAADAHLNAARRGWLQADLDAGRAAQELRSAGVGVADTARILAVSRPTVRKLLANADGIVYGDEAVRALIQSRTDHKPVREHTAEEIERAAADLDAAGIAWKPLLARPGMARSEVTAEGTAQAEVAFVGTAAATSRLKTLLAMPGMAARVADIQAAMARADDADSVDDVRQQRQDDTVCSDTKWDRVDAVVKADDRSEREIEEGLLAQLGLPPVRAANKSGFWADLQDDLEDPDFLQGYVAASARVFTVNQLVRVLGPALEAAGVKVDPAVVARVRASLGAPPPADSTPRKP